MPLTTKSFKFLNFDLEFFKRVQRSLLLHIDKFLYSPHSSANGLYRILSSYLLVRFYLMKKILQSAEQAVFRARSGDFLAGLQT
jgi:hypothetical protein